MSSLDGHNVKNQQLRSIINALIDKRIDLSFSPDFLKLVSRTQIMPGEHQNEQFSAHVTDIFKHPVGDYGLI